MRSAKQTGRRRPPFRQEPRLLRSAFLIEVSKDLRDHLGILDAGDDPQRPAASAAGLDVDNALEALRPGHGSAAFSQRFLLFLIGYLGFGDRAPRRLRHQRSVLAVGREHAVESRQVDPGLWDQRGQPGDQVQRLEDNMGRAVAIRRLLLVADVAVRGDRQAPLRACRTADVAAQPLQFLAFIRSRRHPGMQRKPVHLAHRIRERLLRIAGR